LISGIEKDSLEGEKGHAEAEKAHWELRHGILRGTKGFGSAGIHFKN
jgi:hypothetical protein